MSNTVITNYTDLNGPSTKADSSVVVIVNKDGSLSVDQNLLGTLMGTDGSQAAGISVVRVGHEGKPDDATDSENEDDKVPHVTLSVDSYYNEPNSIIKYDSGAEMLQSLRIETRENSLVGFQNDHCYTPLTSPSQGVPQQSESYAGYDDPVIEITHTPPPKPVPQSKKITILEQQIIPKGKKIIINPTESSVILKGNDVLNKPLPVLSKSKQQSDKSSDNTESSSISSGDSIPDRDSDSDYRDTKDRSGSLRLRRTKTKPRILKSSQPSKASKLDGKVASRLKANRAIVKRDIKEKLHHKPGILERKKSESDFLTSKDLLLTTTNKPVVDEKISKIVSKQSLKSSKKEKKTPAHMTALLSDMTSLFSTPDVIRRVSTDGKTVTPKHESTPTIKRSNSTKSHDVLEGNIKAETDKTKSLSAPRLYTKHKQDKPNPSDKVAKGYDLIPQLDDASLAQILQDTSGMSSNSAKLQTTMTTANMMNSPGLAGPLSPTLDLLGGLQPEEEGLSEDLLMHVAQLVESSENLQEVIDKQVLGKVDNVPVKTPIQSPFQEQTHTPASMYVQTPTKSAKSVGLKKDTLIEIVRRDGRVITLPPIEAPATRSSKRKIQMESSSTADVLATPPPVIATPMEVTPEPQVQQVAKQYTNKKLGTKKPEGLPPNVDKMSAESQESWNSEDDPNRLWCICRQPHNNRFMICCDSCEDWFHGKCVNITKAMGQQMEEQGIEWRCPNCIKKTKGSQKTATKPTITKRLLSPSTKSDEHDLELSIPQTVLTKEGMPPALSPSKTSCIVCKKPARASSIYCSDACILKHAQDSLGNQSSGKPETDAGKQDKQKSDSRVIVYERKSGRLLAGPNAPTAENLKTWLQKNPTFEVVRPGALSTIKPNVTKRKTATETNKVQTTLNFVRVPRKSSEQSLLKTTIESQKPTQSTPKTTKMIQSPKEPPHQPKELKTPQPKELKTPQPKESKTLQPRTPQPRTPVTTRGQQSHYQDTPRPSTSTAKVHNEPKKPVRATATRSQSTYEKASTVSPSTSRRKEAPEPKKKMDSTEPIRDNVRKALQEQITNRMAENTGKEKKFSKEEIRKFAYDTEEELYELFNQDVGMKYKAKYRSLMFNIKDRKNLSLWHKVCDGTITPKQLVRLSPEELASQELAEWRDQESKHQLELIKKAELDLLAATKTMVLKTHKGEQVMETKESVSTELDPNVPVEDVVVALNEAEVGEAVVNEILQEGNTSKTDSDTQKKQSSKKKRGRDSSSSRHSKKTSRESKRESERRKSRSSRRRSYEKEKEERSSRRSDRRRSSRARSLSKARSKKESSKEKSDSSERSRHRSRSRAKSKRRSKSREHSRSTSKGRDRSHSRERVRKRSQSREVSKRRRSSRYKSTADPVDNVKPRSRSQDTKGKTDSTDSDSIERPKSAMQKEVHPEYDPHEPMITSAFSEEDLRKSGGDTYEDSYKTDIVDYDAEYDPTKSFSIDSSVILPSPKYPSKSEKVSEPESDQEPTSTVENSAAAVWNGCINMVDVARFYVAALEVSGNATDLEEDLSAELDIVGRINPDTVWDYISKMKRASNKDIVILKLQAANDEEKMQYIALYSYLSSRNRLGVVKVSNTNTVKDFYIVPLPAQAALPAALQPLDGPGLGEARTHLLIAIVIRQRKKRPAPANIPKDIVPAKVVRESRKRSYTPPIISKSSLPLPTYTSPALTSSVKDKIAATLASADDDEAYSPGSSTSSGSAAPASSLRNKMEELNRQIEEQKQQIMKMAQADSSIPEDEAYSPSRPMTPPPVVPLADIALPSNLQEILATIKQRSENAPADVDMRNLPLP